MFEHFEALLYFGRYADDSDGIKNMSTNHKTVEIFSPITGETCQKSTPKTSQHARSYSDSLLFLQDSLNLSLFKRNWTGSIPIVCSGETSPSIPSLPNGFQSKSALSAEQQKQTPSSCDLLDNITLPLFPSQDKSSFNCDCRNPNTVKAKSFEKSLQSFHSDSLVHESSFACIDTSEPKLPLCAENGFNNVFATHFEGHQVCPQHFARHIVTPKCYSTPKHNKRHRQFLKPFNSPVMFNNILTDNAKVSEEGNHSLDLFLS